MLSVPGTQIALTKPKSMEVELAPRDLQFLEICISRRLWEVSLSGLLLKFLQQTRMIYIYIHSQIEVAHTHSPVVND